MDLMAGVIGPSASFGAPLLGSRAGKASILTGHMRLSSSKLTNLIQDRPAANEPEPACVSSGRLQVGKLSIERFAWRRRIDDHIVPVAKGFRSDHNPAFRLRS